ncbi:MAG: hypothetical protein WKF84_28610 [Pyrinomonadaceae bacterium]
MSSQAIEIESNYARDLRSQLDADQGPSWVARLRESAFDRFEQLGFPTTDDEEWKYTNVAAIAKTKFETSRSTVAAVEGELIKALWSSWHTKKLLAASSVFINGVYSSGVFAR